MFSLAQNNLGQQKGWLSQRRASTSGFQRAPWVGHIPKVPGGGDMSRLQRFMRTECLRSLAPNLQLELGGGGGEAEGHFGARR